MREPIHYALTYPEAQPALTSPPDWASLPPLTFTDVDTSRWPSIELARVAMHKGSQACNALNAANEVAVAAFLRGAIPFTAIFDAVSQAIRSGPQRPRHRPSHRAQLRCRGATANRRGTCARQR